MQLTEGIAISLATLSIILLLVSGGFFPPGLGVIAGIIGTRIKLS